MLLKLANPLLLFSSNALDTVNNTSYENTGDRERCVFPIPHVNFPFESISKRLSLFFFLKGFVADDMPFLFFSASTCKEIYDLNV